MSFYDSREEVQVGLLKAVASAADHFSAVWLCFFFAVMLLDQGIVLPCIPYTLTAATVALQPHIFRASRTARRLLLLFCTYETGTKELGNCNSASMPA